MTAAPSPGRRIGALYLLYFVVALTGGALARGLIVPHDAAATLTRVATHETTFRLAWAAGLLSTVVYLALTAAFYRLFGSTDRAVAMFAALLGTCGCALQMLASLLQLVPFEVSAVGSLATTITGPQAQALTTASLAFYSRAYGASLVLFGCFDVAIGYLIVRSRLVPRPIGWLMGVAGIGWTLFLWPPAAVAAGALVLPLGAIAELVLMFWLLAKGIDGARWRSRAGVTAALIVASVLPALAQRLDMASQAFTERSYLHAKSESATLEARGVGDPEVSY